MNVYNSTDHSSKGFGVVNLHCRDLGYAEKFRRMLQVKAETCNSTSSLFDFSFCVSTCEFMPVCVFVCAGTHVCMCV